MFKKAKTALLCATALFSGACLANTHMLRPHMSMQFNFNPNQPEIIKNPIWWTITATCTIESEDKDNLLQAVMLRNSGMVNNISLIENGSITVRVRNNDALAITAEAYAWVEITNIGDGKHMIKATCST